MRRTEWDRYVEWVDGIRGEVAHLPLDEQAEAIASDPSRPTGPTPGEVQMVENALRELREQDEQVNAERKAQRDD